MNKCELCGAKDFKIIEKARDPDYITKDYYYLEECKNCGLARVRGDFSNNFLSKFYSLDYYPQGIISKIIFDLFSIVRVSKISKYKKRGDVLDIGCGDGRFLLSCKKKGYGVYGIEGSVAARQVAKSKGIFVYSKGFLKENFKGKKFDVITLWQVLEHIDDPNVYLKKIKSILKKEGLLYIGVPNIESSQYKLFRKNWFHLDMPRHLFAYSPKTLRGMLEKNSFKVIKIDHDYLEYNPLGFVQSFFNLILPVFNFPYKIIKIGKKPNFFYILFCGTLVYLLFFPVFLLSVLFYFIDIVISRGATIGAYAKPV